MGVIASAWSVAARGRRKVARRHVQESWGDRQFRWVREHAPGKSFADIGGMFKHVGEVSFVAEEAGATSVTMFDVGDPDLVCEGHEEWGWFEKKKADRGSNVRYLQGNLEEPVAVEDIGVHDVVFCSGVLYHTPIPMQQLLQLRRITRELLYLSTLALPEVPGFPQACVYYPYLDAKDRRPFADGYSWAADLLGIGGELDERPMYGYGNCYWGMTRSALRAMLRTARFEVVEELPHEQSPFAYDVVVAPLPLDPMLPPVDYFRERGLARERGEARWGFDGWYDERRAAGLPTTNARP